MTTHSPDNPSQHLNWGAEALWQQLAPLLPGLSIEVLARADSTNTQLLERARRAGGDADQPSTLNAQGRRQGDTLPCLLVAEQQTRGRGRQGRPWYASAGASLTFSLSLPLAPLDWAGLSLVVGLALADALDPPGAAAPRIGLKWPNDLLLLEPQGVGRKLGGILIETVAVGMHRLAVIGIGLNIQPQALKDLSWGYACLQELYPGLTAPQTLARIAQPLAQAVLEFQRDGFAGFRDRYERRDVLRGRAITTTVSDLLEGVADGVDADGALWLRTPAGRRRLASGEISVRLAADPADPGAEDAAC